LIIENVRSIAMVFPFEDGVEMVADPIQGVCHIAKGQEALCDRKQAPMRAFPAMRFPDASLRGANNGNRSFTSLGLGMVAISSSAR
jgi:hypothetical protein